MNWIENQPVFFGEVNQCSDDGVLPVQLVDNNDKTQFQFEILPCENATQLMPDPNFDDPDSFTSSGAWGMAYNMLCRTGVGSQGAASAYQLDATKYYQINITVESISPGGLFKVSFGQTIVGYISSVGNYVFYGFPVAFFGNTGVLLNPENAGSEICISEITTYEVLSNAIIAIYTGEGVYVDSVNYIDDTTSFVFSKNTVTITIDWLELEINNGCYYLCLLDPCQNTNGQNYPAVVENPDFEGSADGWELEGEAAYGSNDVVIGGGDVGFIYQADVFITYTYQCLLIDIPFLTGSVAVYFGTALVETITTTGIHTICGTPVDNLSLTISVIDSVSEATVESVYPATVDPEDYVCNSQSNTFKLADYSDACTLLINACNNEDGLGFVFDDSGFTPRIRLESKLRQSKYHTERSVYEDAIGQKKNVFFSGRKQKFLCVDLQPEYVHDFLRLLLGFDNFYINNVAYFVDDDEYLVEYPETSDDIGKVKILVSIKQQNIKNKNCSDIQNICILDESFLLQENGYYILQENGFKILL